MNKKNIVVIFPGTNYSTDCPLLYYAGFKYEVKGYERVFVDYKDTLKQQEKSIEDRIKELKETVLKELKKYNLAEYEDVVFIAKSLGTEIAGWVKEQLNIHVRNIFLTPIIGTLPYIKGERCIVIAGTNDRYLNADVLRDHCNREGVYLKQFLNVGHSLEYKDDVVKSIEIIREVVDLYQ